MTRKSRAVFNGGRGLRPKIYQGLCGSCGAQFSSSYCYTLYCSNACRQRAFRVRVQKQRRGLSSPPIATMETRAWQGTPIARRADGFVNATAMCKANSKRWNNYFETDRASSYIETLSSVTGIPVTGFGGLVQTRQGGSDQGTWIHPRVAIDLARWISPGFAVWMDGWFLESMGQPQRQPQAQQLQLAAASPAAELLEDLPSWDLPSDLANWYSALETLEGSLDLEVKARASMIRGHLLMAEAGLGRLGG